MMTREYKAVLSMARLCISDRASAGEEITTDILREEIEEAAKRWPVSNEEKENLVAQLESIYATLIGIEYTLDNLDDHMAWLPSKQSEIEWNYWERYEAYLRNLGWAEKVLDQMNDSINNTLGRLEDPKREGTWDRRGLVVGHVQSGKTSNYIGLICKAVDAGYRVVIVLAGLHDNLRSQTQIRLDEGFLGYDSSTRMALPKNGARRLKTIGVGEINPNLKVDAITTRELVGDFKRDIADHFGIHPGGNPLLFVVKKNVSVLRNLLNWLDWAGSGPEGSPKTIKDVPLLLIDDECDFGSVNTNPNTDEDGQLDPEYNPTRINELIRKILMSFEKRVYIGYTATPFANILIHNKASTRECGDDLFPRSFITCLPSPDNHVGPLRIFGSDLDDSVAEHQRYPLVRTDVADHADSEDLREKKGWMPPKHYSEHKPLYKGEETLPPSLRSAIHSFILAAAARKVRGQTQHNSMLIHVTRFQAVQELIAQEVKNELSATRRQLKRARDGGDCQAMEQLHELWESDFVPTTAQMDPVQYPAIAWTDVEKHIYPIVASVEIKVINGESEDILKYTANGAIPLNVIVVGGDKLARGLTLEGLTTSYFLRPTKMYDTLMQMGRWFGYRPRYLDLCRLYTRKDIRDWFIAIASADEELRRELICMVNMGGTPKDYGLRIKHHPGLQVTSKVKMRNGTRLTIGFGGSCAQTLVLSRNVIDIQRNWKSFINLVNDLSLHNIPYFDNYTIARPPDNKVFVAPGAIWFKVPFELVLKFIQGYKTHPDSIRADTGPIEKYILAENGKNKLTDWTILVPSGAGKMFHFPYAESAMVVRGWRDTVDDSEKEKSDKYMIKTMTSEGSGDELVDLDNPTYSSALDLTIKSLNGAIPDRPNPRYARSQRSPKSGLLILYPIDFNDVWKKADLERTKLQDIVPVIGFAISFPGNPEDDPVEYIVNNIGLEQETGHD